MNGLPICLLLTKVQLSGTLELLCLGTLNWCRLLEFSMATVVTCLLSVLAFVDKGILLVWQLRL